MRFKNVSINEQILTGFDSLRSLTLRMTGGAQRHLFCVLLSIFCFVNFALAEASGPIVTININGPISPASDDFLKTSLLKAKDQDARLFVIELNTPGGLLPSMQTMVESLLNSKIPTVVYVTPGGAGAISAGVFITMAGNFAVMAPGTTIGAAHPVSGGGQDVEGDMRKKIENFAMKHVKAIAEQRGRNTEWAEKAVKESVVATDKEAVKDNIVDFSAKNFEEMLTKLEGRTLEIKGKKITLKGLKSAGRVTYEMSFKQKVLNILCDPNIAILIGLVAMLGLGIEFYHPGAIVPGVVGAICLILSLISAQVLPIDYGGLALLLLGVIFFAVEFFVPSFGIWGIAGTVCFVIGSIYVIDTDLVWSVEGFTVDKLMVGSIAGIVGILFLIVGFLVLKSSRSKVATGKEDLVGQKAVVKKSFVLAQGALSGKVEVIGELWNAKVIEDSNKEISEGQLVEVVRVEGLTLYVKSVEE